MTPPLGAVISGNTVANVIVTDDMAQASQDLGVPVIEYTEENPAGIGWTYDEATGRFNPPAE